MNYLTSLQAEKLKKQKAIEDLLAKYPCQSIGKGYGEIITDFEKVHELIDEFTQIGVAIVGVAWWCHCSDEHQEMFFCPHGLGGPENEFGEGWFSEMVDEGYRYFLSQEQLDGFELHQDHISNIMSFNNKISSYLDEFPENENFIACLTPALILYVPEDWERGK